MVVNNGQFILRQHQRDFSELELRDPHLLLETLLLLRGEVFDEGQQMFARWRPNIRRRLFLLSALNLAYYLALRKRDIRPLQRALTPWGLSSLGRIEARVMPNLDAVINTLADVCRAHGKAVPADALPKRPHTALLERGNRLLDRKTRLIFGETQRERLVRIMVTMPTEAAENYGLVRDLVVRGMDCARINCAHDDAETWSKMIANVRKAAGETGNIVKIAMDLGGPKVRTANVTGPHPEKKVRVYPGDTVLITQDEPHSTDKYPVQLNCTLPEIFAQVRVGERVWFDDGKIGLEVIEVLPRQIVLRVTHAREEGEKLRDEKGINLPDTALNVSPLTAKDLDDLDFVANHADIINYSFVQRAEDIALLQGELAARVPESNKIAIAAKIETRLAVKNLPEIMVAAASKHPFAVMIARGDLAVEIGYERMAEIQEELLWLCEAAHVPVIWATQVLENLAKTGVPTRAEMTDAAMSVRAECVMLNKGEYMRDTVTVLDGVLLRMQEHQNKKTPTLRALRSWADM